MKSGLAGRFSAFSVMRLRNMPASVWLPLLIGVVGLTLLQWRNVTAKAAVLDSYHEIRLAALRGDLDSFERLLLAKNEQNQPKELREKLTAVDLDLFRKHFSTNESEMASVKVKLLEQATKARIECSGPVKGVGWAFRLTKVQDRWLFSRDIGDLVGFDF